MPPPEKVQILASAKRLAKLKNFDLKEYNFELVYNPQCLVEHVAYYLVSETYKVHVQVADIKGTLI